MNRSQSIYFYVLLYKRPASCFFATCPLMTLRKKKLCNEAGHTAKDHTPLGSFVQTGPSVAKSLQQFSSTSWAYCKAAYMNHQRDSWVMAPWCCRIGNTFLVVQPLWEERAKELQSKSPRGLSRAKKSQAVIKRHLSEWMGTPEKEASLEKIGKITKMPCAIASSTIP